MERFRSLPKPGIVVIAIIIGLLAGVGLYQSYQKGFRIGDISKSATNPLTREKTQTIVNEENAIISVVDQASPSVVAISASGGKTIFGSPRAATTIGTGFVVSDKGIIVTNKHVVDDTSLRYDVVLKDGKKYEARKIYRDPIFDLALVQIDADNLTSLELGDSSKLKVGQTVIAIGNALGKFTNTVTTGIVSGLGRRVLAGDPYEGSEESLDDLIQTDAAINPGNSGGPLLNSAGQVIGVNVATTEGAQGISFAIPINSVKKIVTEFVDRGTVSRPMLGIRYVFIDRIVALENDLPVEFINKGVYIAEVVKDGAADKAGVKSGDIVTKIDGQNIDSETKISQTIATKNVGERVSLHLWYNNKERDVTATLQELPNQ